MQEEGRLFNSNLLNRVVVLVKLPQLDLNPLNSEI